MPDYTDNTPDHKLRNLHHAMRFGSSGFPELRVGVTTPLSVDMSSAPTPLPVQLTSSGGALDAFGRQRMSQPFTLFDSFGRYQAPEKFAYVASTGGTAGFDSNGASETLNVTGASGSKVVQESTRVFAYQPGKSLLILRTFCLNPAKANLRQRVGYFSTTNGFYLQLDGSDLSFVRRSTSTGATLETVVNQLTWNVDTLNSGGLNPSGIQLDPAVVQIMFIDMEWLGVGSVRMGFVIDGQFVVCHEWHHANTPLATLPYMTTACLPLRSEIENLDTTSGASTLRIICTSVISEGGYEMRGRPQAVGFDLASPYDTGTPASTIRPLITIRLKSTRLDAIVLPKEFGILPVDNMTGRWYLILGGTTAGGSGTWVSAGTNSSVEYKLDATTISGGTVAETGFLQSQAFGGTRTSFESPALFKYQLERNSLAPEAYEFTVALAITGTNKSVFANLAWEEVT